jgi:GTP-binding protein
MMDGKATTYAMNDLQSRGSFFINPGEDVYAGMIIGENARDMDMDINPAREKHLTNVRSVSSDDKMYLPPPKQMTLEEAIGYVADDELIEVTPAKVRLRKQVLDAGQRKQAAKRMAAAAAAAGQGGG